MGHTGARSQSGFIPKSPSREASQPPTPPKKVTFLFLTVDSITDARSGDISCLPRWHLFPVSFVAL